MIRPTSRTGPCDISGALTVDIIILICIEYYIAVSTLRITSLCLKCIYNANMLNQKYNKSLSTIICEKRNRLWYQDTFPFLIQNAAKSVLGCISMDYKWQVVIRVCQDRWRCDTVDQCIQSRLMLSLPLTSLESWMVTGHVICLTFSWASWL